MLMVNMNQQQNPYDFILNDAKPAKRPLLPGNGSSVKQRLLIAGAGAAILVIIGIMFMNLVFGGSKGPTEQLLKLAQTQTEIVRISDLGVQKAKGTEARNLAITTKLSLSTQLAETTERLGTLGKKVNSKELALGQNPQTDTALDTAEQASRFDEEFLKVLNSQLADYQTSLQSTYSAAGDTTDKDLLSGQFDDVAILLGQE